ncbi:MAG: hypothetical protein AB8F78_11285 [Saprospiraceae bacterium]
MNKLTVLLLFLLTIASELNAQFIIHESSGIATVVNKDQLFVWDKEHNRFSDSTTLYFNNLYKANDNYTFVNFAGVVWYFGADVGGELSSLSWNAYVLRTTIEAVRTLKSKGRFVSSKVFGLGPIHTKSTFRPKFGLGQDSLFKVLSFTLIDSELSVYNVADNLSKQIYRAQDSLGLKFTISNADDYVEFMSSENCSVGHIFQSKSGYTILFGDRFILQTDSNGVAQFKTLDQPTSIVKRRATFFLLEHELVPSSSIPFLSKLKSK